MFRLKQSFEGQVCDAPPLGLLVLVPVVLGVERLNSVYTQQLKAILRWPHSVGIVGGRPGHSYYFMGFQVWPPGDVAQLTDVRLPAAARACIFACSARARLAHASPCPCLPPDACSAAVVEQRLSSWTSVDA